MTKKAKKITALDVISTSGKKRPKRLKGNSLYSVSGLGEEGPKSGRLRALAILDEVLAEPRNLSRLRNDLALEMRINPTAFFREIIMPLLPKEKTIDLLGIGQGNEKMPIRIELTEGIPDAR